MSTPVYFAVPGDLQALTGGYAYDRRLLAGLEALGWRVQHLPLSAAFPVADALALDAADRTFARLPEGACVIVDGLAYGVMAELALRQARRLRLVALCHHPLALEAGLSEAEAARLQRSERRALGAAVAVIVTSRGTASVLQNEYAVDIDKITVAPPGTDRQAFAACVGNPPLLLTVATLTRRKAHDVLIAALAKVHDLPWRARFVGGAEFDPEWARWLREFTALNGLDKRIEFVGAVHDPGPEYGAADMFVLPSLFEGYGMAFAEALAFGLPIVGARAGAVPGVVPESAGILVEPGDSAALAAALEVLLTQPAERSRLQRGAQRAAAQLPTWEDTARTVAGLLTGICAA